MTTKHHDHPHRIELKLHEIGQLFNSMDPAPFNEKDLDADAEEFIVGWAQEYPLDAPLALRIYLTTWPDHEDPRALVRESVHHYFTYRAGLTRLEFRRLMDQGRKSMVIGLGFLAICFIVIGLLPPEDGMLLRFLRESLLIAGWVAMWRPMQTYLYDWWPLRRRLRIFTKLGKMPVEVVHKE